MKLKKLRADLETIEANLDFVRDVLSTNHEFTRLIEEELGLDVKAARADAWISANKAAELADPYADKNGAFGVEPWRRLKNSWRKRIGALHAELTRERAEFAKVKEAVFSDVRTPWEIKEDLANEKEVRKLLDKELDELAEILGKQPRFKQWVDEHRADPQTRAKLIEGQDPQKQAQALCLQIEHALLESARHASALITELT